MPNGDFQDKGKIVTKSQYRIHSLTSSHMVISRVVTVPVFSVFWFFGLFLCQAWVLVQSFSVPFSHHCQVFQLKEYTTNIFVCHLLTAISSWNMIKESFERFGIQKRFIKHGKFQIKRKTKLLLCKDWKGLRTERDWGPTGEQGLRVQSQFGAWGTEDRTGPWQP